MRLVPRLLRAVIAVLLLTSSTSAFALDSMHRIEAVSFSDATHGVMAGGYIDNNGFVSATTDGGLTWSAAQTPSWMRGAAAAGVGGWGVGDYFTRLWGSSDGQTWSDAGPIPGAGLRPFDVAVLKDGRIAVVGQEGGHPAFIKTSTNGGASWESKYSGPIYPPADAFQDPPLANAQMQAISAATGGNQAWAIANEWQPSAGADGSTATYKRALAYKTIDGGLTWTNEIPMSATAGHPILDVAAVNGTTAFAVGLYRNFHKTVNGTSWTGGAGAIPRDTVAPTNVNAYSVDALDANRLLIGADYGRVVTSANGGTTFTITRLPGTPTGVIRDVEMLSDSHWIAVGDDETIFHTYNAGQSWQGTTGRKAPVPVVTSLTSGMEPSGTASDGAGVGVAAVEVTIRKSSGEYFNGSTWQQAEKWLPAVSSNGWKSWSYPGWTLPSPSAGYSVTARATDGLGSVGLAVWTSSETATTGSLRGKVTVAGGSGLSGASVKVGVLPAVATSADGSYDISGIAPGVHQVTFSKAGYISKTVPVSVVAGVSTTQDAALLADAAVVPKRLSATNRFAASAVVARDALDADPELAGTQWNTTHVVLASGDDRAAADPLSAAGLAGVYRAPLLLVSGSSAVDTEVKKAIKEMAEAAAPASVTIHIVGGTVSVPDARFGEIQSYVGTTGTVVKDRLTPNGDRYVMAETIARRMMSVDGTPTAVLIANGADPTKFFDALALSPIAAQTGYPVLLVSVNAVPTATQRAINTIKPSRVIVGGGPMTVSNTVVSNLKAQRWASTDRYTTARTIADNAVQQFGASRRVVGVASTLPYALIGGASVGMSGGVLVLTAPTTLTGSTSTWLSTHKGSIEACKVFGDTTAPTESVKAAIEARLKP